MRSYENPFWYSVMRTWIDGILVIGDINHKKNSCPYVVINGYKQYLHCLPDLLHNCICLFQGLVDVLA